MSKRALQLKMTILPLFLLSVAGYADSTTTGTGRIVLSSVPDSALFYINGLEKAPDAQGAFTAPAGTVLFEIKRQRVVVFSSLFQLNATDPHTIPVYCANDCALLHVNSEPAGAIMSIDGIIVGTTPFLDRLMAPGEVSIMLTKPGYIPVIRRLELTTDSSSLYSFELEQTQAVKDSVAAVKRALRRKRQRVRCLLFGGVGCVALAAGGYFDYRAYRHLQDADNASDAYDAARSEGACVEAKGTYTSQRDQAERPILCRNVLYGVAGACLAGFYLSIVF